MFHRAEKPLHGIMNLVDDTQSWVSRLWTWISNIPVNLDF